MPDTHAGTGNGSRRDADDVLEAVLAQIRGVLQGLRFGSVTIVVQDGVVVQIDRTEKRRLQPSARRSGTSPVGATAELPTRRNGSPTIVNVPLERKGTEEVVGRASASTSVSYRQPPPSPLPLCEEPKQP
jgi:hypothetical protein